MRVEQNKRLSINQIKKIEPRIIGILNEAAHTPRAGWPDYSRFKQQLIPLVGYYCKNEAIRTSNAYETTIEALYRALRI